MSRPTLVTLACALVLSAGLALSRAQDADMPSAVPPEAPAQPAGLVSPAPPAHARRSLDSPSDLVKDFAEVVSYLDAGQAYFRAYQKGTHTVEDNKRFLAFLEAYEREYAVAKKESLALRTWVMERGSLDAALKP
ncbi:MAG: hypothetical protein HY928_08335 [Elusimicrobia bacterium]|nr:hypothetical protein [Elusimicrobiota bacterium]